MPKAKFPVQIIDGKEIKQCSVCNELKELTEFSFRTDRNIYRAQCKKCYYERKKPTQYKWIEDNKEKLKIQHQKYYIDNKEVIDIRNKQYNENHKEELKEYSHQWYEDNKPKLRIQRNKRIKNRRKEDPMWALKKDISSAISHELSERGSSKMGKSTWKSLPYTIEQLWEHLEKQFTLPENLGPNGEVWMTRENRGIYDPKTWNDNDYTTWTWQLDHIKPHSEFYYKTMGCQEFLDCWALSNLRPYSAKQNFLDGVNKIRHNKE